MKKPRLGSKNKAHVAYRNKVNSIGSKLAVLKMALDKLHDNEDEINWAHVGDLARVEMDLDEMLEYLTN